MPSPTIAEIKALKEKYKLTNSDLASMSGESEDFVRAWTCEGRRRKPCPPDAWEKILDGVSRR